MEALRAWTTRQLEALLGDGAGEPVLVQYLLDFTSKADLAEYIAALMGETAASAAFARDLTARLFEIREQDRIAKVRISGTERECLTST